MDIYIPSLENKSILEKYLRYNTSHMCEYNAVNPVLWSSHYSTGFTIIRDMLVFCRLKSNTPWAFTFPIGEHNPREAFDELIEYFDTEKITPMLYLVSPEQFEMIDGWYNGIYEIEYDRDSADYLYETQSLATLSGKKLHGKRNHINRFLENYPDYKYEHLCSENICDCLSLAHEWARENKASGDYDRQADMGYESCALEYALKHREELGMQGALIRVDGRAVAFTLGSGINKDTFDINFEKAYADVQGAYAMINREFVRRELLGTYRYVNREEDMGLEGLRYAKTSYQPVCLIEKGIVRKK